MTDQQQNKTYYITTPLYYVNALPHLGSAYTTFAADILARWKRMEGRKVVFLTGTDEHGQKILEAAEAAGIPVKDHVDRISEEFQSTWKKLDITNDDFIRTTEDRHIENVREIFRRATEKGDIYKGLYEGPYCVSCERFWPPNQLKEDNCPDCGKSVRQLSEENYFFKLSSYADAMLKHFEENPDFVLPRFRASEMTNRIKDGLQDLSVTRSSFTWGIPMPDDEKQVIYVWFDALINYVSAAKMVQDQDFFNQTWPADVHFIGKEINWFHSVIWPSMLMAAGIEPPKCICAHGWLTVEGEKMSKSKGNFLDPIKLVEEFGKDQLRYYLFRDIMFGKDGDFSRQSLVNRVNWDLANDLGNLLHRTTAMVNQYFDGVLPEPGDEVLSFDTDLAKMAEDAVDKSRELMNRFEFTNALEAVWVLVRGANKYIDLTEPWLLARQPEKKARLGNVMYNLVEAQRFIASMITPFIPDAGEEMSRRLNIADLIKEKGMHSLKWGEMPSGRDILRGEPLFPRIELPASDTDSADKSGVTSQKSNKSGKAGSSKNQKDKNTDSKDGAGGKIKFDEFMKADLRVGEVKTAEPVEGADRLYHLTVDIGEEEPRNLVAGIRESYPDPAALIGMQVVVVANLKPAKIRGIKSYGMILAAKDENGVCILVSPSKESRIGAKVG